MEKYKKKVSLNCDLLIIDSVEAVGLFRSLMQIRSQHLSTIYKHNLS